MTEICIRIHLPPKGLNPNTHRGLTRGASMGHSKIKKAYRGAAYLKALEAQGKLGPFRWPSATVTATFFHKVKRARDEDNAIASLKAAIDGVADAGLIVNDSGLRWNPPRFEIDKTRPRVELVFAPVVAAPRVVQMTHSAVCECGCQAKGGERGEG